MIAIRTVRALKTIAILLIGYLGAVAITAGVFIGDRPYWASFKLWLWGLPVFVIAWFAIETAGKRFFERPAIQKLSSPARIAIGVVMAVALLAVVGAVQ